MQTPHQPPPHQAGTDRPPPTRHCDVIMKGGITSGVVYPLALVELSRAFRLKNIGGTSAGAIAASAAAAAELGRGKPGAGFDALDGLPAFLSGKAPGSRHSRLFDFFQPQPETRRLFRIGLAALGNLKWIRIPLAVITGFWPWALGGALPGLAAMAFLACQPPSATMAVALVLGAVVAVIGTVVTAAWGMASTAQKNLGSNFYGLCSGLGEPGSQTALTDWLTAYLDRLAGRPEDGPPLTFGDLWQCAPGSDERVINLEMMTTCLSHGRPYRLPFGQNGPVMENSRFYFHEDEFRRLFPKRVVDHMIANPRQSRRGEKLREKGYHPLPEPGDLPIVVATRMSLSFPVLLSAIPLHAFDYDKKESGALPKPCWFSDGGICSNFPVHFFDELLPNHPSFAINLADKSPDSTDKPSVWMPEKNNQGMQERWQHFEAKPSIGKFLGMIMDSSRAWMDNTQARLPGYRDRIATVSLSKDEGGLNLNMPSELITALSGYGRQAGRMFVQRFSGKPEGIELTWDNHRRVRLRSMLAAVEELAVSIDQAIAIHHPDDRPYDETVMDNEPSYKWKSLEQRDHAARTLQLLRRFGQRFSATGFRQTRQLKDGAPSPRPALQMRSRI